VSLAGAKGTDAPTTYTYTLETTKPITALLAPATSTVLNSNTITAPISTVVNYAGAAPLSSVTPGPTPACILTTTSGTATCSTCSLAPMSVITNISGSAVPGLTGYAPVTISGCTGAGSFSVSIAGGIAQDSVGNLSTPSNTLNFTIDMSYPTSGPLSPATGIYFPDTPFPISVTFSQPVWQIFETAFPITSTTCSSTPSITSITQFNNLKGATITLAGGTCSGLNSTTVSFDPTVLRMNNNCYPLRDCEAGRGPVQTGTYITPTSPLKVTSSPIKPSVYNWTLHWGSASATTPDPTEYEVVYSTTNNIDTLANAQKNGTVLLSWTTEAASNNQLKTANGSLTYTVTTLTDPIPSSNPVPYYFSVLARNTTTDFLGNYPSKPATTLPFKYVYITKGGNGGNMGGIEGGDTLCKSNIPTGFPSTNVKALLAGTSRAYPNLDWVFSPNTSYFAYSDFLLPKNTCIGSTDSTGAFPSSGNFNGIMVYTGIAGAWNKIKDTCSDWSSTSGNASYAIINSNSIDLAPGGGCANDYVYILCVQQ